MKLSLGESCLDNAPCINLDNNGYFHPQHYLMFKHNLKSVESIILDIEYDPKFIIFAYQHSQNIYIKIGVVGFDNYDSSALRKKKIVYGRNWLVEPDLPTSEIIQTVFLALKNAKEHENRELFKIRMSGKTSTPFNNHHDLPLMANMPDHYWINKPSTLSKTSIVNVLSKLSYGKTTFKFHTLMKLPNHQHLLIVELKDHHNLALPELATQAQLTVVIKQNSINHFLHSLMDTLIKTGNRHIDENFTYKGFRRFSWLNNVNKISDISIQTRNLHKQTSEVFISNWDKEKYRTDANRVPKLTKGKLTKKIIEHLSKQTDLLGFIPDIK